MTVNLSLLTNGSYRSILFEDGLNVVKGATDYKNTVITVTAKDKLNIKLASGGGWVARFEKIQ
ncbi:glycoside hydrolase family 97 C-terminal domain-containing protein [Mucilaginibacter agri]|uniref:glycoside hydrolase family 97 C-terminal domain-containing protein n=1 Tax=Mucilaginibacter agri TaxID=2695265 RepID=UPI00293BCB03|nr:glycoside hydrolase family 97 C-terminal domain-containing protein [Mucilaginibacter agri]